MSDDAVLVAVQLWPKHLHSFHHDTFYPTLALLHSFVLSWSSFGETWPAGAVLAIVLALGAPPLRMLRWGPHGGWLRAHAGLCTAAVASRTLLLAAGQAWWPPQLLCAGAEVALARHALLQAQRF